MQRFENILACVDLDGKFHPALQRAITLAKQGGGRLKIVAVYEGLPTWASLLLPSKAQNWEQAVVAEAERRLQELSASISDGGVDVETKLLSGLPYLAIIREAVAGGHDLVLKPLELESTLENPVISSLDMHLLRKCPGRLWLIRKDAPIPFRRILAAVDPQPEEDERSVNFKVLEMAVSLARQDNSKLFIVRAYESIGETMSVDNVLKNELSDYMEHIQMVRIKADREIIGRFVGGQEEFDVRYLFGSPSTMIADVAAKEKVDLIVMGTIAHGGVTGKLMGRTAENVLRQTTCSVLGVKPDDFICPI
jgi:nucleotide-binding universal stress UspA family protein